MFTDFWALLPKQLYLAHICHLTNTLIMIYQTSDAARYSLLPTNRLQAVALTSKLATDTTAATLALNITNAKATQTVVPNPEVLLRSSSEHVFRYCCMAPT